MPLLLEWNSPKITFDDLDAWLRNYLGDNYDGYYIDGTKLWIITYSPCTEDQEAAIKDWFYTINDIPIETVSKDPKDSEGRLEIRRIVTKSTWLYQPKSLDFYTAKYNSLYNRKHDGAGYYDGTDVGDAYMQFYDAANTELIKSESESSEEFQARLASNCIKTVMSWENEYDFDVQGAILYIGNTPIAPAWLWCIAAPDIPEAYGGSLPFMGRGMNLKMMAPLHPHVFDAVSASTIITDPIYHSNKVSIVVKHGVGEQIGIQFIVVVYEMPPS